jgi:hypothetical protein
MLAHAGGRVAGGAISRAEVLDRFGPGASLRAGEAERVDLLLTTDVLSEGVNLQGASVVLHLDLTWNPARLEQRVGRLRRFGAARDSISVYVFAPPAPAERLLHLDERLRIKLGEAARSIGVAGAILPGFDTGGSDASAPREERLTGVLRRWRGATNDTAGPVVAATRARINGALACVRIGDYTVLVVVNPGGISESRAVIERMVDAVLDGDLPGRLQRRGSSGTPSRQVAARATRPRRSDRPTSPASSSVGSRTTDTCRAQCGDSDDACRCRTSPGRADAVRYERRRMAARGR